MMQAVYYRAADGSQPVSEFIDGLQPRCQAVLDNQIDRLNGLAEDEPPLPFPHSSQIDGELRELRCHYGRELYRVFYRRSENLFVLLHAIRKDCGAISDENKRIAQAGWHDFKERMDASARQRPRAIGWDAP